MEQNQERQNRPQTMKAVVFHGINDIRMEERPVPVIRDPKDVIVRVVRSTICTSDLHIRNGAVPRAAPGIILGHEFAGEVVETGSEVTKLKAGMRVAANCETFCGTCYYCKKGFVNNCEHGGWELGCRIDGCQAEYVRVPYADMGLTPIPDTVSYEDALFTGDILSSGFWGAEIAEIQKGDCVAVIGAGPVGLCAAESAKYLGAGTVILIDRDAYRLNLAMQNGLTDVTVNTGESDAADKVRELTEGRGADAVIEAAGGKDTFELAWKLARPNAVVSVVAMYEENQILPLPSMYGKNLTFKTGGVDANRCPELLSLIEKGDLRTDFLITHRSSLGEIMEGYRVFEAKEENCMKWVITADE